MQRCLAIIELGIYVDSTIVNHKFHCHQLTILTRPMEWRAPIIIFGAHVGTISNQQLDYFQ